MKLIRLLIALICVCLLAAPISAAADTEETAVLMPKILIQSVSGGEIQAGGTAELHITLKNMSRTEALLNLTVTAAAPAPIDLQSPDTLYFERVKAYAEFEAVFSVCIPPDAPAGAYILPLQYDFALANGMTGFGGGNVRMAVSQPAEIVKMEFPTVVFPAEAVVTDRLELHLQALNLGKAPVSNVRAELKAEGLLPEGVAFIGEVAGGTAAEAILNVLVSSKRGADPYGETAGQITFTYTDNSGGDHSVTKEFSILLKSPFSEHTAAAPEQADSRAWVWIMAGIGGGILLLAGLLIYRRKRGRS